MFGELDSEVKVRKVDSPKVRKWRYEYRGFRSMTRINENEGVRSTNDEGYFNETDTMRSYEVTRTWSKYTQ